MLPSALKMQELGQENRIQHGLSERAIDEKERPAGLKLKSGGSGRPLGSRVLGSRSSSKNGWMQASNLKKIKMQRYISLCHRSYCHVAKTSTVLLKAHSNNKNETTNRTWCIKRMELTAEYRKFGEYWSSLDTRSTASGGVLLWKIYKEKYNQRFSI